MLDAVHVPVRNVAKTLAIHPNRVKERASKVRVFLLALLIVSTATLTVKAPVQAEEGMEEIALSLATLLRSARAVISDNQAHINGASIGDKGLSGTAVVTQAKANFLKATGHSVDSLLSSGLQGDLLKIQLSAIASVMDDAQGMINEQGVGFKGFLPAIFARQVAVRFSSENGHKADLKLTAPKAYVRNRANRPDKWEHSVIETKFKSAGYPNGQHFAEAAPKKGKPAYRLIIPEYYNESCLSCHGSPKGERDITGGKKEGGTLGELGGAISIAIYK